MMKLNSNVFRGLAAVTMLASVGGCGNEGDDSADVTTQRSNLYGLYPLWPNGIVPVCFSSSSQSVPNFTTLKNTARQVIQNGWGRAAKLQIYGFDTICPASPAGTVKITLQTGMCNGLFGQTTHGGVPGGGYYANQSTDICSVVPNTNFVANIMHEMGHALGMGHEHERPDWNQGCATATPIGSATVFGTPPDTQSIMDTFYGCNTTTTLSPWDIVGLQNAYGRKQAGALVATNNQCLDVPNNVYSLGLAMQVFDCNANAGQSWRRSSDYTVNAPGIPPSYLDVRGAGGSGSTVQIYSKNSPVSANQQWLLEGVQVLGTGDKCIDVPSGSYVTGQSVQQYTCNGGGNQKWTIKTRIHPGFNAVHFEDAGGHNYCIAAPTGAVSGSLLTLQPCNLTDDRQRFDVKSTGEIKYGSLCWDLQWNDVTDGRLLQLYTCSTPTDPTANYYKRNQLFHTRGPVKSALGTFMTTPSSDPHTWDAVTVATTPSTDWDYYFKE